MLFNTGLTHLGLEAKSDHNTTFSSCKPKHHWGHTVQHYAHPATATDKRGCVHVGGVLSSGGLTVLVNLLEMVTRQLPVQLYLIQQKIYLMSSNSIMTK